MPKLKKSDKKDATKTAKGFGKKEKVINYACQTYQLSRPNKVGAVMGLIRECQPKTFEEWQMWYFQNAYTDGTDRLKITKGHLKELGTRLYNKIITIVIPEWQEAFANLTEEDCIEYVYNLTLNRTFDGYIREKSVVFDNKALVFPDIRFEEAPPEYDHALDIDFFGFVKQDKAIGLQIKPITAKANFGNYSPSERMKRNFQTFEKEYGGKVFIVFSEKEEIKNKEILEEIREEINRLREVS